MKERKCENMSEINWGELADIEFDSPDSGEGFAIKDDRAAGWAMRKIAKIQADKNRMIEQINARLEEITAALQGQADAVEEKAARDSAYFEGLLAIYFDQLPDDSISRTKAGRMSYALPEGKLMVTAPKREYRHDDIRLLEVLKENGMHELIRRKEAPDWSTIKKHLSVDDNGSVAIVGLMGEVVETDAIVVVDMPGEFRVEVE